MIVACCRNPADRAALDTALMGKHLEQKLLKPGYAWTVVIRSLSPSLSLDITGDKFCTRLYLPPCIDSLWLSFTLRTND